MIIGLLIGLTGTGGGTLMTPVMILVMGVKPVVAIGTDLAYSAITRIIGGGAHLRQHTVHRRAAWLLAVGSVPSTILGVGLMDRIRSADPSFVNLFLLRALGWALIVVALALIAKPAITAVALRGRAATTEGDWRENMLAAGDRTPWVLPLIGAAVGFMVGLTSVGAGSLVIIALLFLYPRWSSRDLVGTDVFHAAVLSTAAGIAQFASGNVNVPMMGSLLIGSIPGVLVGSRLAFGFPEQLLRLTLAAVLLVSGAKLV
ncbi:MAG: sulfite exporter TauE/SafE family protein [Chloroflexota bacterium]